VEAGISRARGGFPLQLEAEIPIRAQGGAFLIVVAGVMYVLYGIATPSEPARSSAVRGDGGRDLEPETRAILRDTTRESVMILMIAASVVFGICSPRST
jgi:hypothetical protein